MSDVKSLLDQCSCLDAAYERQALLNGSAFEPVFPENLPYRKGKTMIKGSKMDEYDDHTPATESGQQPSTNCGWHMDKREAKDVMEGMKYDAGKPDYSLFSPAALDGTAQVLTMGAAKYGRRNWESGILYGRIFAACMRHLWAWWNGEEIDPESGLSHLHHAACNVMMLQHYASGDFKKFDDRPK